MNCTDQISTELKYIAYFEIVNCTQIFFCYLLYLIVLPVVLHFFNQFDAIATYQSSLQVVVQKEIDTGAVLQQTFEVEYTVGHQFCSDCHRVEAKDFWKATLQVKYLCLNLKNLVKCAAIKKLQYLYICC